MVLLVTLIGLLIPVYKALEKGYGITENPESIKTVKLNETDSGFEGNIIEQFENLRLVNGLSGIVAGIKDITSGSGVLDILGGLAGAALGILKSILGLLTIPYDIAHIISEFYGSDFPELTGIVFMVTVYTGFILLSAYLRKDI